jgi:hypothetical protein
MIPYWYEYEFPEKSLANRDDFRVAEYTLIDRAIRSCSKYKEC